MSNDPDYEATQRERRAKREAARAAASTARTVRFDDALPLKLANPPPAEARIVWAACFYGDRVFVDWRHSEIHARWFRPFKRTMIQQCQGFVDQFGNFWDREEAGKIAHRAGQTADLVLVLTSEDLWDNAGVPRVPGVAWEPGT